jgi:hypothetical protein
MADVTGPARESLGMASPPIAGEAAVIDAAHLARMTLGDRKLEREVLELFDRQAEMLLARMRAAEPAGVASLATRLSGRHAELARGGWRRRPKPWKLQSPPRDSPRSASSLRRSVRRGGPLAACCGHRKPKPTFFRCAAQC